MITLSKFFGVSLDELVVDDAIKSNNTKKCCINSKELTKKITVISTMVIFMFLVIGGILSVVKRSQILYPGGAEANVVITRKEPIQIGKGSTETVVFSDKNKPTILCEIPKDFSVDTNRIGLYTDSDGNFISFNADYLDNVFNPLVGTDYYNYYVDLGYESYIEMANAAMYFDVPKLGVFSSKVDIYLAGGAQLLRQQLCAGQYADYYAIEGGLIDSGDAIQLYGFALCFENTVWMITLKDYNDVYYYITIKDPVGIGKNIDTIADFLGSINY